MTYRDIDDLLGSAPEIPADARSYQFKRIHARIIESLTPVRPLAPPRFFLFACAIIFLCTVAIGLMPFGMSGWSALRIGQRIAVFGTLSASAVLLAISMVGQMVPGSKYALAPATLPFGILTALVIVIAATFRSREEPSFIAAGWACLRNGLTYSIPAAFLFWLLVRRGAILYPKLIGAAAGGLAGLIGLCVLEINCANLNLFHILVWHWGVVLISSVAGALAGAGAEYIEKIMSKPSFFAAVLTLSAGAMICGAADDQTVRVPVLLELFTSEGCSSCPPADRLLDTLDQKQPIPGADLIVLSEHVDYWDRLGWKDPFSSSQYTARQQDYTNRYHFDGVYTPQLVVDGRYGFVGSDGREASSAIQKAIREHKIAIAISNAARNGNQVTARIELPADQNFRGVRGILYVALADNRQESQVARGENAGRSLAHVAVTRVLKQLGIVDLDSASSTEITLSIQSRSLASGSRLVAFIQDPKSGHVLGVTERKL